MKEKRERFLEEVDEQNMEMEKPEKMLLERYVVVKRSKLSVQDTGRGVIFPETERRLLVRIIETLIFA